MAELKELEARIQWLETVVANRFPQTIAAHRIWIVETIQGIVCEAMEVRPEQMLSERRFERLAWARHVAMTFSYELSGLSTLALAPLFNRLDHSTIIHARSHVREEERMRGAKAREVEMLRARVREVICSPAKL